MTGSELKAMRKKLGLSLAEASKQVEVSVSTWCRWENGTTPVPRLAATVFKLMNRVKS